MSSHSMTRRKSSRGKSGRSGKNVPPPRADLSDLVRSERFCFVLLFGLSCLGFHALTCVLPLSFVIPICVYTARSLGDVLSAFGLVVVVNGNIVSGSGLVFQIVLECTALFMA